MAVVVPVGMDGGRGGEPRAGDAEPECGDAGAWCGALERGEVSIREGSHRCSSANAHGSM